MDTIVRLVRRCLSNCFYGIIRLAYSIWSYFYPEDRQVTSLSDEDEEHLKELKRELIISEFEENITGNVEDKVTVYVDTAVIRLENLDTDLTALEVNVDGHFAHSSTKRVVREAAETMFVTLRNTKEMEEIERRYDHQKIQRGEDGELYGVEIHYIIRGQQNPSGTRTFYPLSGVRPSNPVMMIAYRILVKTLEGYPDDDIPDKAELEALEI